MESEKPHLFIKLAYVSLGWWREGGFLLYVFGLLFGSLVVVFGVFFCAFFLFVSLGFFFKLHFAQDGDFQALQRKSI